MERKRQSTFLTVAGVSLVPVVCLLALAISQFALTVKIRQDAIEAKQSTINFILFDKLIQAFQLERGNAAGHIRAQGNSSLTGGTEIQVQRGITDNLLDMVDWPPATLLPEKFRTKEMFRRYLQNYRDNYLSVTISNNIKFYINLMSPIIRATENLIIIPGRGDLGRMVEASGLLLRATEPIQVTGTLLRTFSWYCEIPKEDYYWLLNLEGEGEAILNEASALYEPMKQNISRLYRNSQLQKNIESDRAEIKSANFTDICLSIPQLERRKFTFKWFHNVLSYYRLMIGIRNDMTTNILRELDKVVVDAENDMMKYAIITIIIAVLFSIISIRQVLTLYDGVQKLDSLGNIISKKEESIRNEKQRTEQLLYQMIPQPVAVRLSKGEETAQLFSEVTISYIDIVGFVALISQLKPTQVAALLQKLYGMFDSTLDQYKVHKMEQNNDVYCVVSGIPEEIESHAVQVADFILHIMRDITSIEVKSLPGTKIQARAGIHTGPCAAGVIGTKIPRYSIFGESVKMASRMSRIADVQEIRISKATRTKLRNSGENYIIKSQGSAELYGIGKVKTYSLTGSV